MNKTINVETYFLGNEDENRARGQKFDEPHC